MTIPAMATEVFLAEAVPNTSAASPSLMDGNNNLENTPPATGNIVVPESPKGASLTPRAYTSGFNFVNTITSTQESLKNIVKVESAQQGIAAISNVASITVAGVSQASLQVFKWS